MVIRDFNSKLKAKNFVKQSLAVYGPVQGTGAEINLLYIYFFFCVWKKHLNTLFKKTELALDLKKNSSGEMNQQTDFFTR